MKCEDRSCTQHQKRLILAETICITISRNACWNCGAHLSTQDGLTSTTGCKASAGCPGNARVSNAQHEQLLGLLEVAFRSYDVDVNTQHTAGHMPSFLNFHLTGSDLRC